jgi:hypothetical protein
VALVLQLMVFGYTYRWMYAGALAVMSLWPLITPELQHSTKVPVLLDANVGPRGQARLEVDKWVVNVAWAITCCTLGAFTLLPLDIHNSAEWMLSGGVAVFALCVGLFFGPWHNNSNKGLV